MIDEKIEQIIEQPGGPPAAPPPLTTQDKLRAAWARFQCSSLLRSHRIRTRTRLHAETLGALVCALPLAGQLGDWLYTLGFTGEYTLIRAGRAIRAAALWLAAAFLRGWNNVMEIAFPGARTVLRELFGPVYVLCRGLRNIWVHGAEVRRAHGFWAGIAADLQYLGRGAVRYAGLLPRMAVYLLPLASLAVLVAVVQMMVGRPYTLAVEVNGSTVGNVANETVFDAAREDVLQRVNYAGTTAGTESAPKATSSSSTSAACSSPTRIPRTPTSRSASTGTCRWNRASTSPTALWTTPTWCPCCPACGRPSGSTPWWPATASA